MPRKVEPRAPRHKLRRLAIANVPEQQELVKQYYKGNIPHVVVLNAHGETLYNQSGEVGSAVVEDLFKRAAEQ
jgi:hypothetical protein